MGLRAASCIIVGALAGSGQQTAVEEERFFEVVPGTKIPLSLINSISTKNAAEGDRVYLETAFPVLVASKIVVPVGSYVAGTVTQVKRAGRIKGRAELFIRFDSLTLPNGVTRDFRARVGGIDGQGSQELDRSEGKIKGEGNKSGDARTVGEAAAGGTTVGAIAGSAAGRAGMGAGIGAAAGATAGLIGVLMSRGPDAILTRGSTLEMVLDRSLRFSGPELDFGGIGAGRRTVVGESAPPAGQNRGGVPIPGRRLPPF